MRVSTDDGQFGFILARDGGQSMFRFQLVIGGEVVGTEQPCQPYHALAELRDLPRLNDARLAAVRTDPAGVFSLLLSDDALSRSSLRPGAESLDHWSIRGYASQGKAVMLARARDSWSADGRVLVSVIGLPVYLLLVQTIIGFWSVSMTTNQD